MDNLLFECPIMSDTDRQGRMVFFEKEQTRLQEFRPRMRFEKNESPPSSGLTGIPVGSIVAIRGERGSYN
ncbi:MAG: hypothetical protein AB1800_06635, partial [Pseudomonadota bacterium]